MTINPEDRRPPEDPNKVREIRVFSIDKVESDDDLFDFRPNPLPSSTPEDEEVDDPKVSSATEPVENSNTDRKNPPPSSNPVSVDKDKSQEKKAS